MTHRDPAQTAVEGTKPVFAFAGEIAPGTMTGDYIIGDLIARGGCGAVYVGSHLILPRRVAIKVLDASLAALPKMVERFVREVEVVNLLRHPNIVDIYDIGTLSDGRPFYVMEYLGGETLASLLKAEGRLSPEDTLDVLEPVCSALGSAHRAGIVHRDIKASNISVQPSGDRRTVKLLDFGIAKLQRDGLGASGLTSAGRQLGSPSAMAPEQILGEQVDARTDIYALGVLLYKLLTGHAPFRSTNLSELARQHLEEPPPRPSQLAPISPEIDAIVLRCMQKRPEQRFESVRSFRAALRQAIDRQSAEGRETCPDAVEPVVAIDVELRLSVTEDEMDDALADDLGHVLDDAEARLRAEGFVVALQTGSAILAIRTLAGGPEALDRGRIAALALSASLHEALVRRPGADARVGIAIGLHVAPGVLRGEDIVGGAIMRTGEWAPPPSARGVFATPAVVEGLPGFADVAPGRQLIAIT